MSKCIVFDTEYAAVCERVAKPRTNDHRNRSWMAFTAEGTLQTLGQSLYDIWIWDVWKLKWRRDGSVHLTDISTLEKAIEIAIQESKKIQNMLVANRKQPEKFS